MGSPTALADAVVVAFRSAVAPLLARLAALEARDAVRTTDTVVATLLADVRTQAERIAALEVRAPVAGPPGPAGRDGVDGVDGLGVDDLRLEQTDDRTWTVRAVHGDRVRAVGTITVPLVVYRGVYRPGSAYQPGDVVTYGGSAWHCHTATDVLRPDTAEGAGAWRLMVKRGDRGKDAR